MPFSKSSLGKPYIERRRIRVYARTPEPTSRAAAGKSTDNRFIEPPLEGSGPLVVPPIVVEVDSPVADNLMTPAATRSPDSPEGSVW